RPTARWRSCSWRSSPRRFPWRSACCTATPRPPTKRTSPRKRGPRGSLASPPTSGRYSAARGRGPWRSEGEVDLPDPPARRRHHPGANRWERTADLPAPRHHMPLAVVGDTLYAVGGLTGERFVPQNTLWLYREDVNRWEPRAALPAPRGASGAASVSGKLIVVGGWGLKRRLAETTAIYDPAVDRWRDAAPIPTPRDHLAATAVNGVVS